MKRTYLKPEAEVISLRSILMQGTGGTTGGATGGGGIGDGGDGGNAGPLAPSGNGYNFNPDNPQPGGGLEGKEDDWDEGFFNWDRTPKWNKQFD